MQASNPSTPISDVLKLVAYVAGVLVGAAVLAPWLEMAGQALLAQLEGGEAGGGGWLASEIRKADIARYFSRSGQLMAVLMLGPLIWWTGMDRSLFPPARPIGAGLRDYGWGFSAAAVLLLALGVVFCQFDVYRVRSDAQWWALWTPLSAALGAGVLEEWFFRGALLGLLLRSLAPMRAAVLCTGLFAFVHFLKPPAGWDGIKGGGGWTDGFQVLGSILGHFSDLNFVVAEFATLFAVGWVLALARLRTGQLWLSMGLHGGWIFGLKYFSAVTKASPDLKAEAFLPWIGVNLKIGLAPLAVIALTGWVVLSLRGGARGRVG